jgi:acyl-CoA dehydrogenase
MTFRRDYISHYIFKWAKGVLPGLSNTEREAIEAGDVWWDADLFTGNPDWAKLLAEASAKLSSEEQAFLDGPVAELCAMLDDWHVNWDLRDLPPEAWDFLKTHKFFAMIIPKQYGGLGFSAYAHSQVVRCARYRGRHAHRRQRAHRTHFGEHTFDADLPRDGSHQRKCCRLNSNFGQFPRL